MMSMKIRGLFHYSHDIYEKKDSGSNRRSKTEMGAGANDRSGFVASAASTIRWRARRRSLTAGLGYIGAQ